MVITVKIYSKALILFSSLNLLAWPNFPGKKCGVVARLTLQADDRGRHQPVIQEGANPTNIIPAFYLILYSVMCEALCTQSFKWFQHHSLKL